MQELDRRGASARTAGVDNIWEFYGVLNEEYGNVVANTVAMSDSSFLVPELRCLHIPVALISIELDRETADVANSVSYSS